MKFLIAGGSGFIGKSLTGILKKKHHQVKHINRADYYSADNKLEDLVAWSDVIVNLAGANISKKWTKTYKQEIYDSRISLTKKITDCIKTSNSKPKLFISTSAVGFYDDLKTYDEEHFLPAGNFLGDFCSDWETIAMRASKDTRVVVFRLGVVLGRRGGIIKKLRPLFNMGLGAILGSGQQTMSWVHISDVLNAIQYAVKNEEMKGIYNLCTPSFISNQEFSKSLAKVLKKPLFLKIPDFFIKIIYGEGSDVMLKGQKVLPKRLISDGFNFRFLTLDEALKEIFRKK